MYNDYLPLDVIKMFSDQLKHCFVRLSQEMDFWLEGLSSSVMDHKMEISTEDHGPSSSNIYNRRSSATTHTAHSGHLSFSNTHILANPPPPMDMEGVGSISSTVSDSSVL